jgi:ABC-type transport system involved in multi-copper enzyme maturation permease subunit
MPSSPTKILFRDELIGYAKSRVILVMWVLLPALAVLGYLLLPDRVMMERSGATKDMVTATAFMAVLMSSLAGTVTALLVAVDIVSERNRKVYELFAIRPLQRDRIIWAKFFGVFVTVSLGCVAALLAGIVVDAVRGHVPSGQDFVDLAQPLAMLLGTIAVSAGVGCLVGVMSRSILVAVLLILYVGQNLAIVPMLPILFGILPDQFWIVELISFALAALLGLCAGRLFRRSEF